MMNEARPIKRPHPNLVVTEDVNALRYLLDEFIHREGFSGWPSIHET
jgi:hypothetical protein